MTTESLRKIVHAAPFKPFTLHMADGRSIKVPHPDFIAFSGSQTVLVGGEDESDFAIVDLLLVTQLEVGTGTSANH